MSGQTVFVSRLVRLPLLDSESSAIGKIDDVVLALSGEESPRVLGYVATVQRRHIFINANRVSDISPNGVFLRGGTIDLRIFKKRSGEKLAQAGLMGTRVDDDLILDLALGPQDVGEAWEVKSVALGRRGRLRRRRSPEIVPWSRVAPLFQVTPEETEVAELRDLHPTDVADRLRSLPLERRQKLAELLEDDRLADLIEEVDEEEAVRIIESLDVERAAHVLEEMEPDDAVDLLADLPEGERFRLLDAMDPEEAAPLRRLLSYDENSAGGLMTPEPVVLQANTSVGEALAYIRTREIPAELAAQVFVVRPPTSVPTGRFVGVVGFQRLLREPPASTLEHILNEDQVPIPPDMPLRDVAERLASYDLLALPVCDAAGRLIGAVTVDDVLDQLLPRGLAQKGRAAMMRGKRDDLSSPTTGRSLGVHYDPEAFGAATEGIARFLGTGRYLAIQTLLVIVWITLNVGGWFIWNWDTYPFILLNLAFSTQAAYAAPLILLAQNRQDDRDRAQQERDRDVQARTQADTEYLARAHLGPPHPR